MAKVGAIVSCDLAKDGPAVRYMLQTIATREGVGELVGEIHVVEVENIMTGDKYARISCFTDGEAR